MFPLGSPNAKLANWWRPDTGFLADFYKGYPYPSGSGT